MLGIQFGIQPDKLHAIKVDDPTAGVQQWKCEMFHLWLKSNLNASWRDVVEALKLMGENVVAETIQQKYLTSDTTGT